MASNSEDREEESIRSSSEEASQPGAQQPNYQIRPDLADKFKPLSAKEEINNVLVDFLSSKLYDPEVTKTWCKEIADMIKKRIKELKFKNYKYVVNVILGENKGAGVKIGTRCIWDAEADSYAHSNFKNDTIWCEAVVFAVYTY